MPLETTTKMAIQRLGKKCGTVWNSKIMKLYPINFHGKAKESKKFVLGWQNRFRTIVLMLQYRIDKRH